VENIICIKDIFPKLSIKKVIEINNIINNKIGQTKPKINMTIKSPLRKQIIILMNKNNSKVIGNFASPHISNINKCFKKTKLNTITDFIWIEYNGTIITTNKALTTQDMSIIEIYLKEIENINLDYIDSSCLLKSKSYLKILSLSITKWTTHLFVISKLWVHSQRSRSDSEVQ